MSDFDKEAEREKLREQLEREEESREATQHMSELLLKGATMTNKHCDDCGDPVFRYEGQEFCPTCGEAVGAGGDAGQPEQEAAESAGESNAAGADRASTAAGGEASAADRRAGPQAGGAASGNVSGGTQAPQPTAAEAAPAATDGDLTEARAALVRKLTRLARQAEATDDAGRSRELLAAAREAAEALAAVDRVER